MVIDIPFKKIFIYLFWPILGSNTRIPAESSKMVVEHMVVVHESVEIFSKRFLQKLRRSNHVTPKNYLDFIHMYSKLLEEKNEFILGKTVDVFSFLISDLSTKKKKRGKNV